MQTNAKMEKNNKLIETLVCLEYFELSEKEALDLALENKKVIVEIVLEDEHEKRAYEETSHLIKKKK